MSEEIEAVRIAMQGTEMTIKLAGTSLKDALLLMKYIATLIAKGISNIWSSDAKATRLKNKLTQHELEEYENSIKKMQKGSIDFKEFNKLYNANERQMLQIPDESIVEFEQLAKNQGIAYCLMPDNNLNDGLKEIMVTTIQSGAVSNIIDTMSQNEIKRNQEAVNKLEEKKKYIDKIIEQYERKSKDENLDEKTQNEYLEKKEYLKKANSQIEEEMDYNLKLRTKEITLQDYINRNKRCTQNSEILVKEYEAGINEYGCFELKDALEENPINISLKSLSERGETYIQSIACPNVYVKKNWYIEDIDDIDDTEFEHNYSCQYELYINNQPTGLTYESNTYEPRESEMSDFIDNVRKKLDEEIDNKIQNGDVVYSRELKNWTEVPDIKEVEKREIFTKKNPLTIDGMSMEELINDNKAMKQVDKSFLKGNKSNKEHISLDIDMTRLTKYKGNEYKYYITNNSYFIFQKKDIEDVNKKNGLVTIKLYKDAEKYDIYTEKIVQVKEKVIEPVESNKRDNSIKKLFNFDKTLTDITERRDIRNSGKKIIICNIENPQTHIEAFADTKEIDGRSFICTQYDLYVDGEKIKCDEFSHGEFTHYSDSRANNSSEIGDEHWNNIKLELKTKGGFKDDVLIFESKDEYKQYLKELQKKEENIEDKDAKEKVTENIKNVKEVVAEKIDINDLVDKIKERTDTLKNRKFNTFSENIKNSFSNIRKK